MARKIASTAPRKSDVPPGYSEDPSAGPMLRFEKSLPTLPIPTIPSTAAKYLETVKPHLTAQEYMETHAAVEKFIMSPHVHKLQDRLQERAQGADSWLSEWWNDAAYMGYRKSVEPDCNALCLLIDGTGDPVVVFVSYFYVYLDDALRNTAPKRAAALLKAILAFRVLVESYVGY